MDREKRHTVRTFLYLKNASHHMGLGVCRVFAGKIRSPVGLTPEAVLVQPVYSPVTIPNTSRLSLGVINMRYLQKFFSNHTWLLVIVGV